MKTTNIFVLAAAASIVAGGAMAQNTAFANEQRVDDALEKIEDRIEDSYERNINDFSNTGRKLGWDGSLSATLDVSSGNTDTTEVGLGLRQTYFDGKNGHRINLAYSYAEDSDNTTEDDFLVGYDYTRDFSQNAYAFAKLVVAYDEFDTYEYDGFAGFGVGYRVANTPERQWQLQLGPGYRYAELSDSDETVEEAAVALSSYYSQRLSPTMFVTNDTDVLWSETDTTAVNELALNVSMTDAMALRTSLRTDYTSDPQPGFEETDNKFGLSVVYNLN